MTDRELLNAAREASKNAYVPYSKFHVGAALECADGRVFTGCNVENAALGSTICAERTALVKAVSLTTDRRAAPETKTSSVWSNPYGGCFFLFYRALDLIIVFTPKYRRQIIYKQISVDIGQII